jgi:4'-phosphopantetheinyl transferase
VPQGRAPEATAPALLLIDREDPAVRGHLAVLPPLLSDGERVRWLRYRREEDRERSLLARGVLRIVLGRWLGRDPAGLRFAAGPHGKPFLADGAGRPLSGGPRFNVSHSGRFILLGVHGEAEVGVDVEEVRAGLEWGPIARRCLSADVMDAIASRPRNEQVLAFHRAWCRLEAGLKARGVGLAGRPASSGGAANPSAGESLVRWDVSMPRGYVGAAALLWG